jgi:hypothetical protein
MKRIPSLFILLCWITAASAFAQEQNEDASFVRKIADNILKSNSCSDNFHFLTKNIGGRMAGSPAMGKAEQWVKEELKKAGADSVWLQACKVNHWERGGKDSAFISYTAENGQKTRKSLHAAALGNSLGSGSSALKAPLLMVNSFEELGQKKEEASGKIIFFGPRFKDGENPINEYSRLAKYRTMGAAEAAKYGAKGVIVRSLTNSIDDHPHTGGQHVDPNVPPIPAIAVSTNDANIIEQQCLKGNAVDAEIFTHGRMFKDTTGNNVVGELKGWEFPDRYITIGAHLDSWDIAEGASDDGTGVVITLEILRVLKETGFRPRYTIRFVLFADEENGINGALAYASAAAERNEIHVFAIESDAGCFPPYTIGVSGLSPESRQKLESFSPLFKPYKAGEFSNGGAADIGPLNQNFKTPIASLWSDQQQYFRVHHSTADTYENTDSNSIKLGAINLAIMLYLAEKYDLN